MIRILILLLFSIGLSDISAQENYRIDIEIDNYEANEVVIGYYYGARTLVKDTIVANEEGKFIFSGQDTLDAGVYLLLIMPDNQFVQFVVNPNEKIFSINTDASDLSKLTFRNSQDNKIYHEYLNFLDLQRNRMTEVNGVISHKDTTQQDITAELEMLKVIDEEVKARQQEIIENYPETVTSLLVKAGIPIEIPTFEGTEEEVQVQRYKWFKTHYFDAIEMDNPISLFTPILHERIEYYVNKLTPQAPDSIKQSIDYILNQLEPANLSYQYYLSHFLNTYAKSEYVGFDAIYVHLVDNYYAQGKAPWVDGESLENIVDNARRLSPTLIGKTAPDFTVYKQDKTAITLSEIESDFTVLFFWAPDCGHCKKALPYILEFKEEFETQGVEILAICNQVGQKTDSCWEAVVEKGMTSLTNVADQYQRSRILSNYYVKTTPLIFILDSEKKILIKRIAAERLSEILNEFIRQKNDNIDTLD